MGKVRFTKKQVAIISQVVKYQRENPKATKEEMGGQWLSALAHHSKKFKSNGQIDLFANLALESDRGCVLVAATIIDEELEGLLRDFFSHRSRDLATAKELKFFFSDGGQPPLRSTTIKIRFAFILGLINRPLRDALLALQTFRSKVAAHSRKPMRLMADDVSKIVTQLLETSTLSKAAYEAAENKDDIWTISDNLEGDMKGDSPKFAFTVTAMTLLGALDRARRFAKKGNRYKSTD